MEKLQELKEEAYKIATETYTNGYRWSVDARLDAIKAYAQLVFAENLKTHIKG